MSQSKFVDFTVVKYAVSIVQVLEHYNLMTQMRQSGDSLSGACPIHGGDNKTSFRVSVSKNCWNCFSRCGGGNVLDFVAKKEKVSILKAAHLLMEWFHLKIESAEEADKSSREKRPESRPEPKAAVPKKEPPPEPDDNAPGENKPLQFTLKNLQQDYPYFAERKLSPETVQTFGLGFCQKGLLNGRVVIPILNASGQLLAYAGRIVGDTSKEKYLFPKGFRKSLELFNLSRALQQPNDEPLVIVEGFFDCMNLWQHGVKRVVALMGSSLSAAQEELLRKHTTGQSHVILMLDEDEAGREAREKITPRIAKFAFIRIHSFDRPGTQPDQLNAEEVAAMVGCAQ